MIASGGTATLGLYDFKAGLDEFGKINYWTSQPSGYPINKRVMLTDGTVVQSTTNNNTNDPNTNLTGWVKTNSTGQIFNSSGVSQDQINTMLKPKRILLQDFVTPEQNGDASLALSLAVSQAVLHTACTIDFEFYEYQFKSKVSFTGLNNIRFDASDAVLVDTLNVDEIIVFNSSRNVRFDLNTVVGTATYANHIANGAVYTYFIKFKTSTNCRISNAQVSSMRSLVQLYNCTNCRAYDNDGTGFLPNVDFATTINNVNFLPLVNISGGRHNKAYGNHAENHGSCVLIQSDSFAPITHTNTGKNLHDNGVYGSSTNNSISFANSFDWVRGSGVKPRGSNNIVMANTVSNAENGVSNTGNGSADSRGANGFGNITAFNTTDATRNFAITVDIQDGLYCRNPIVAFNSARGHLGTGVNAPFRINAVEGHVVVGNTFDDHSADYGMLMIATSAKAINKSGVVAFNVTASTPPIIRSTYGQYGVHLGNLNSVGTGIQYRFQENTLSAANLAIGAPVVDSGTYPCLNMTYVANAGSATNIASQSSAVVASNRSIVNLIDATLLTPLPTQAGLLARDSAGASYISALIGSTLSWKKITVT